VDGALGAGLRVGEVVCGAGLCAEASLPGVFTGPRLISAGANADSITASAPTTAHAPALMWQTLIALFMVGYYTIIVES
jgi:hypothetical protein